MKTRYAKPFEGVQVKIPYESGMDPYSGLLDMFEKQELLVKQGNRLKYTTAAGEELLEFRKGWTGEKLEIIMNDISNGLISNSEDEPLEEEIEEELEAVEE